MTSKQRKDKMQNVVIRVFKIICLIGGLSTNGSSQNIDQFKVTSTGIAPIKMTIDSLGVDQIHKGVVDVIKAYCNGLCSISDDGDKAIQVDAIQQMAFIAKEGWFMTSFDVKFTLKIQISDHQINFEYKIGAMYPQGRAEASQLTYYDFFKKNGTVKEDFARSRDSLERSINTFPLAILQHLKKISASRLISNPNEKGYVRAGARVAVWQYFDSNGKAELSINHTNGKLIYQKPDTTSYVVIKNGAIVRSKLDVRPMPINGFENFFKSIDEVFHRGGRSSLFFYCKTPGQILVSFDVDTLGITKNWTVATGTSASRCDSAILNSLKSTNVNWIPARSQKRKLITRLAIPIVLAPGSVDPSKIYGKPVEATYLDRLILTIPEGNDAIFDLVENSAEFIGGLNALSKWLAQNMKYPPSARRMGLEGKVAIKFIIEPNGAVSNINLLKGFDDACDREALRVISLMPNWKPGTIGGIPVRQSYVMPVTFRLGGLNRSLH